MQIFATEFPVSMRANRASFIAHVKQWLNGTQYSKVFREDVSFESGNDYSSIEADTGETLAFREVFDGETPLAIGFRHDNPDSRGRLWRTEAVIRFSPTASQQSILRMRTACLANTPQAVIEIPKKPHLIKSLLMDGWGGKDGLLSVRDSPYFLSESLDDIELAVSIIN